MKSLVRSLGIALLCALPLSGVPAVFGTYTFGDDGRPGGSMPGSPDLRFSPWSTAGAVKLEAVEGELHATGWTEARCIDTRDYLSFTVTPRPGRRLHELSLSWLCHAETRGTNAGPRKARVAVFVQGDSRAAAHLDFIPLCSVENNLIGMETWNASRLGGLTLTAGQPVQFRFYGWNQLGRGEDLHLVFDEVTVSGTLEDVMGPENLATDIPKHPTLPETGAPLRPVLVNCPPKEG